VGEPLVDSDDPEWRLRPWPGHTFSSQGIPAAAPNPEPIGPVRLRASTALGPQASPSCPPYGL
jgi:hypothetical protein